MEEEKVLAIFEAITSAENIALTSGMLGSKVVPIIAIIGEDGQLYPMALILDQDTVKQIKPVKGMQEKNSDT